MRLAAWLGVIALIVFAHQYDRSGALDVLPALIAALVGAVFARTLRRGRTPLIARAIAAIDGVVWLDDPVVSRYARRLTCLWALYQFALAGVVAMLALQMHGWLTLPVRTTPGEFGLFWLPGAVALLFVGEFALRPLLLPQVPRHNLFVFVAKLIRCWPALLRERTPVPAPHWSERHEGGGRFAVWLIRTIGLHLGRPTARALLYPITLYFFFRRGPERRASRAFLSRAFGTSAGTWSVLRHIHCYAATILDRVFLLARSTRGFDIRIHGLDQLETQIARGRGVLLLGAHIGSFEALRVLVESRPELRVRVIMDRGQTPALTELLHALNPAVAGMVIDVGGGAVADIALAIRDAAQTGALIGLLGDRARPGEATREAQFYGAPAAFPIAPYLIASALELPVVLCFGLYRGGNRYDVHFETLAERIVIPRAERAPRLAEWTQRYAARLQHYTQFDPYNWFNFYDFWHRPAAADRAGRSSVTNAA